MSSGLRRSFSALFTCGLLQLNNGSLYLLERKQQAEKVLPFPKRIHCWWPCFHQLKEIQ